MMTGYGDREFGEAIRELRLERELTQEALAAKAGLAVRTVWRVEAGHPCQGTTVWLLARAFGYGNPARLMDALKVGRP